MFTTEKALVQSFRNTALPFLAQMVGTQSRTAPYFIMEEFDSLHGVADLVLGTYKANDANVYSRKTLNWNWIRPLLNLREDAVTDIDIFMEEYGISRRTATARLREYVEAGFLAPVHNKGYRLIQRYQTVTGTIIAIEAKLRDWKKALAQACRYKRFAHHAFVLLDDRHIRPAVKHIDLFRERNIGLLSMTAERYTIHHQPARADITANHSSLRLSEAAFEHFKRNWASA